MSGLNRAWRAGCRWLYRFCQRFKEKIQEPQRYSERLRQEAISNERRATRRALILLLQQLNPKQRQEFREYRCFYVTGASSGDRYRIRVGTIANVDVFRSDGMVKHRLCARPVEDVPVYDVMAAQLLYLQDPGTEQRFLLQANVQATLPEDHGYFRAA